MPRLTIFTCSKGHLICGACEKQLVIRWCPTCRDENIAQNRFVERLAAKLFETSLLFCRYSLFGCKKTSFGLDSIVLHEGECKFKREDKLDPKSRLACKCQLCEEKSVGKYNSEPTLTCRFAFLWHEMITGDPCCCTKSTACSFANHNSCLCYRCSKDKSGPYWLEYVSCSHSSPCLAHR